MAKEKKVSLLSTAKQRTEDGLSDLFKGRKKLSKKDRKAFLDIDLTVSDFDIVEAKGKHYVVIVFLEKPDFAYGGGKILTEIFDAYVENFDSVEEARAAYKDEGEPLVIRLEMVEGEENDYVKVTVVNDED